jgi:hypothetical protein
MGAFSVRWRFAGGETMVVKRKATDRPVGRNAAASQLRFFFPAIVTETAELNCFQLAIEHLPQCLNKIFFARSLNNRNLE